MCPHARRVPASFGRRHERPPAPADADQTTAWRSRQVSGREAGGPGAWPGPALLSRRPPPPRRARGGGRQSFAGHAPRAKGATAVAAAVVEAGRASCPAHEADAGCAARAGAAAPHEAARPMFLHWSNRGAPPPARGFRTRAGSRARGERAHVDGATAGLAPAAAAAGGGGPTRAARGTASPSPGTAREGWLSCSPGGAIGRAPPEVTECWRGAGYNITITNVGSKTCQLVSRNWQVPPLPRPEPGPRVRREREA